MYEKRMKPCSARSVTLRQGGLLTTGIVTIRPKYSEM